MEPNEILRRIDTLWGEIEELKKQYRQIVQPCANTECRFHNTAYALNCELMDSVTTCTRYIPEGGDQE